MAKAGVAPTWEKRFSYEEREVKGVKTMFYVCKHCSDFGTPFWKDVPEKRDEPRARKTMNEHFRYKHGDKMDLMSEHPGQSEYEPSEDLDGDVSFFLLSVVLFALNYKS